MEKLFLVVVLLVVSGSDKKKVIWRNKPKPTNKCRSYNIETRSNSLHDLPLPPSKKQNIVDLEGDVQPIRTSLIPTNKLSGPHMWMSSRSKIDRIIMSEDWEAFQKKGLVKLDFAMYEIKAFL